MTLQAYTYGPLVEHVVMTDTTEIGCDDTLLAEKAEVVTPVSVVVVAAAGHTISHWP